MNSEEAYEKFTSGELTREELLKIYSALAVVAKIKAEANDELEPVVETEEEGNGTNTARD